ncbi:esterase family protein [Parashewanella spongiae]|uniref:Esterase family protein n=1 Tax=Parashewanella spongiae TaxID=342950 RepID=A0A3A6U2L7_9GAMM|nr:alpha/beta hydrolase-fold protein [Parashewanella spongiae]MCL1079706.1 esterase family protein [Parashewanella spongiae]RJY07175.1 esterase family protein [Parashewanella spongiae]
MNKVLILLSLLIFTFTQATNVNAVTQEDEQIARTEYPTNTLYKIWLDQQINDNAALDFYNTLTEKHILELNKENKATVTYFAKGSDDTEYIMQSGGPDFYGLRFKQIGKSGIYYCLQAIPLDAWFAYGVNEFKRIKVQGSTDLEKTVMEHIYDGAVIGPNAPLSVHVQYRRGVPKGTIHKFTLESKFMNEKREIQIYLPADYNQNVAHNLVFQLDGQNYSKGAEQDPIWHGWTPLPTILDNLIYEQKIGPTIAVFIVNQGNRSKELISERMTDFIALELLPWFKENYNIVSNPKNIVVSGPSRAGFTAANTALRHSNLIGSVLSQSGSFYYTLNENRNWPIYPEFEGKLLSNYKLSAKKAIQFYLDVGLYDLGLAVVGTNRQFRDVLQLQGYQVDYYEYKGGHSHLGWRHTIANGLISLIGIN